MENLVELVEITQSDETKLKQTIDGVHAASHALSEAQANAVWHHEAVNRARVIVAGGDATAPKPIPLQKALNDVDQIKDAADAYTSEVRRMESELANFSLSAGKLSSAATLMAASYLRSIGKETANSAAFLQQVSGPAAECQEQIESLEGELYEALTNESELRAQLAEATAKPADANADANADADDDAVSLATADDSGDVFVPVPGFRFTGTVEENGDTRDMLLDVLREVSEAANTNAKSTQKALDALVGRTGTGTDSDKGRIKELEDQVEDLQNEESALRRALKKFEDEAFDTADEETDDDDASDDDDDDKLVAARERIDALQARVVRAEGESEEYRVELEKMEDQRNSADREVERLRQELLQETATLDRTQAQLDEAEAEREELEAELEAAQAQQTGVSALRRQIKTLDKKRKALEKELGDASVRERECRQRLSVLTLEKLQWRRTGSDAFRKDLLGEATVVARAFDESDDETDDDDDDESDDETDDDDDASASAVAAAAVRPDPPSASLPRKRPTRVKECDKISIARTFRQVNGQTKRATVLPVLARFYHDCSNVTRGSPTERIFIDKLNKFNKVYFQGNRISIEAVREEAARL